MKQNMQTIYLQISTAQGPAECRIFARFVLGRLLAEAKAEGVEVETISETADQPGLKTGISAFSACLICLKCRLKAKLSFKPAVRAAKAGSTSIKLKVPSVPLIKQAVFPCGSKANAVSMPTKNWL